MKVKSQLSKNRFQLTENTTGFILDKTIATNSPKRMEGVKILIANTCNTLPLSLNITFSDQSRQPWILIKSRSSVPESK